MLSKGQFGALPGNSEGKPMRGGMEQCNSITLRSGKEIDGPRRPKKVGKELELPLEKENGKKIY